MYTMANSPPVKSGNLPHLLLYGPPGTGKTTCALAMCHQMWPDRLFKNRVLELNASDERGLSIVRNKIKGFANLSVSTPTPEELQTHPCPPFKIILLDESDTMTTDAQAALRRIIEAYSKITRFVLICNYVTRIITPLASRCAKFRFKALETTSMKARLQEISKGENVSVQDSVLDTIITTSGGDMRRAVTTLQSTCAFSKNPTSDDVYEMSGIVPASVVVPLITECQTGQFKKMQDCVSDLMCRGYPAAELLKTLGKLVMDGDLADIHKAEVSISIANAAKSLIDGADEELQILNVSAGVVRAYVATKAKAN